MSNPASPVSYGKWSLPCRWEWVLFALLIPVAWIVSNDYGMAWDDAQHAVYGGFVLDYFQSGFTDEKWLTDMGGLYNYGTLFDLPSAILHRWLYGEDLFALRSFLMAITGLLAIPAVAKLGRFIGGESTAVWSVAALLAMPQFVGQSFINCKDLPLATAVAWSMLAGLRLFEKPSLVNFVLCGLTVGLALAVRVGGLIAAVFLVGVVLFLGVRAFVNDDLEASLTKAVTLKNGLGVLLAGAIAWGLMIALWPVAHRNPFVGPLQAFQQSAAFPTAYPVLYLGESIPSADLPWHYLPVMFGLTMPLPLLVVVVAGILGVLVAFFLHWDRPSVISSFLLLFWIFFPLGYVAFGKPNIYDGVRHFLFIIPAFAVVAGVALSWLTKKVHIGRVPVGGLLGAVAIGFCWIQMVLWHPYQYSFFNRLAGEPTTLHERFETDYWATSYRDLARFINAEQAKTEEKLHVLAGLNQLAMPCLSRFIDSKIGTGYFVGSSGEMDFPTFADFVAVIPRYEMWKNFSEAPIVYEVRRRGVLMGLVRKRPEGVARTPVPEPVGDENPSTQPEGREDNSTDSQDQQATADSKKLRPFPKE
ncbi:MAG: glycosyltransferase family 39 protein [Verrucomicrobiia bacterium]